MSLLSLEWYEILRIIKYDKLNISDLVQIQLYITSNCESVINDIRLIQILQFIHPNNIIHFDTLFEIIKVLFNRENINIILQYYFRIAFYDSFLPCFEYLRTNQQHSLRDNDKLKQILIYILLHSGPIDKQMFIHLCTNYVQKNVYIIYLLASNVKYIRKRFSFRYKQIRLKRRMMRQLIYLAPMPLNATIFPGGIIYQEALEDYINQVNQS